MESPSPTAATHSTHSASPTTAINPWSLSPAQSTAPLSPSTVSLSTQSTTTAPLMTDPSSAYLSPVTAPLSTGQMTTTITTATPETSSAYINRSTVPLSPTSVPTGTTSNAVSGAAPLTTGTSNAETNGASMTIGTFIAAATGGPPVTTGTSTEASTSVAQVIIDNSTVVANGVAQRPSSFVPLLGAWMKPLHISHDLKDPIPEKPPTSDQSIGKHISKFSDILPPELKEDGSVRFPWAAKMDPKSRNLHRTTLPTYLEDGTPMVIIPDHVLMYGLENQKEYVIGQFYRCTPPSGGLIHAVTNRIWGNKCKIITRKLGDSSFMFHIPDESTRKWVLERGLWHIDGCIMFVAPWTASNSLVMPEITSVPVWVTLKNIPACLYSHWGISWIASGLGEPMLSNKPWLDPSQMGEAKLMVEVELEKGFPQKIAAGDKKGNVSMVSVEYSWIPSKCQRCGLLGHKESRCLLLSQAKTTTPSGSIESTSIAVTEAVKDGVGTSSGTAAGAVSTHSRSPVSLQRPSVVDALPNTPLGVAYDISNTVVGAPAVTMASPSVEAEAETPVATEFDTATAIASLSANTATVLGSSTSLVSFTTPLLGSPTNLNEENVFRPPFAVFDSGTRFEIGDHSQRTRGGRSIKPTQKVQENQWTIVGGRKNKGRGRGGRGPPF